MKNRVQLFGGLVAGAGVLTALVPGIPAAAAQPSLDVAVHALLRGAEAKTLGVSGPMQREFGFLRGAAEPVDGIWLCDRQDEEREVEVRGARHIYNAEFVSVAASEQQADQEIHDFKSAAHATRVWTKVKAAAGKCSGTFTRTSGAYTITVKLSNGRARAVDGTVFTWVNSVTVTSDGTTNWADHDYVVVQHSGRFVQVLSIDSEGVGAPALTKQQRSRVDALSPTLLTRWTAAAG